MGNTNISCNTGTIATVSCVADDCRQLIPMNTASPIPSEDGTRVWLFCPRCALIKTADQLARICALHPERAIILTR